MYKQNRQIQTGDKKYSEAARQSVLVSWRGLRITGSKLTVVRITVNKGDFCGWFRRTLTSYFENIYGRDWHCRPVSPNKSRCLLDILIIEEFMAFSYLFEECQGMAVL